MSHSLCPTTCPHCAHPLPPAAPAKALEAASALLLLPRRSGTRREIADALHVSPNRASQLLRDAEAVGLVSRAGMRGRAALWRAEARVLRAYVYQTEEEMTR